MLREATRAELKEVADQIEWVRQRWQRIPNIWASSFEGRRDDLRALDYVGYEGLDSFFRGEGVSGWGRFAVVFANVLVRELGFRWVVPEPHDVERLLLKHDRLAEPFDPVQLIREESEKIAWGCPNFNALYGGFAEAVGASLPRS